MFNPENVLKSATAKADILNRGDLEVLAVKKAGTRKDSEIFMVRYAYGVDVPTRVQIQAALNRDFGGQVAMDPCQILVGPNVIVAKVYSRYAIPEQDAPKAYRSGLKVLLDEAPKSKLVETGDIVRCFNGYATFEAQVVGYTESELNVRLGDKVQNIGFDSVIDVKAAPRFSPVSQEAYEYFLKLFPKDFVELMCASEEKLKALHGKQNTAAEEGKPVVKNYGISDAKTK